MTGALNKYPKLDTPLPGKFRRAALSIIVEQMNKIEELEKEIRRMDDRPPHRQATPAC